MAERKDLEAVLSSIRKLVAEEVRHAQEREDEERRAARAASYGMSYRSARAVGEDPRPPLILHAARRRPTAEPKIEARPPENERAGDWSEAPVPDGSTRLQDFDPSRPPGTAANGVTPPRDPSGIPGVDRAELREMIREVFREEVRTRMGKRINENIRKIVRQEIANMGPPPY